MATGADERDAALRADIRGLGEVLGAVIREQWGEPFFQLEEEVRIATRALREQPDSAAQEQLYGKLADASLWEVLRLVRAFTIYFHIANTAEQHHRVGDSSQEFAHQIEQVLGRAEAAGVPAADIAEFGGRLTISPVFTAHPTEAARRSILDKLQSIDDEIARWRHPAADERARQKSRERIAELIEGVVQTDELRLHRPEPLDEARNVIYYLEHMFGGIAAKAAIRLSDALSRQGVDTESLRSPLRFESNRLMPR